MKTLNLKNILIKAAATIIVLGFITLAVIHVIHLTNAGLINWNN